MTKPTYSELESLVLNLYAGLKFVNHKTGAGTWALELETGDWIIPEGDARRLQDIRKRLVYSEDADADTQP